MNDLEEFGDYQSDKMNDSMISGHDNEEDHWAKNVRIYTSILGRTKAAHAAPGLGNAKWPHESFWDEYFSISRGIKAINGDLSGKDVSEINYYLSDEETEVY